MQKRGKAIEKQYANEVKCVKKFFREKNTIIDMLDGIIERSLAEKILHFSVGIEDGGNLTYYSVKTNTWIEETLQQTFTLKEKYTQIEQYLSEISNGEIHFTKCCKRIGCVKKENENISDEERYIYIYYYLAVKIDTIEPIFFHCIEKAYYDWIIGQLSNALKAVSNSGSEEKHDKIREYQHNALLEFRGYLLDIYGIDIENVTTLSGLNYERESCCSNIVFSLKMEGKKAASGVTLGCPIDFERKNIKKIRKLLQMGKEGQCLLACKRYNKWQITGLYEQKDLAKSGIAFQFKDHMVWDMEIKGKFVVRYKYGKYIVEGKQFELDKLGEKYKEVFGKENNLKGIFEEAIDQKHGTILIIIEQNGVCNINNEVSRLVKESTGIQTVEQVLPSKFTDSVTTIDGALFISDSGTCYGFGMILDSTVCLKGNPERGARFNSTRKYVKMCQEKGFKAMGIVISEDGMVNIFTTNDDFGEEKNDGRK